MAIIKKTMAGTSISDGTLQDLAGSAMRIPVSGSNHPTITVAQLEGFIASGGTLAAGGVIAPFRKQRLFQGNVTNVFNQWSASITLPDGRIYLVTTKWGDTLVDGGQLVGYGQYSSDGGKTFGDNFSILPAGVDGSLSCSPGALIRKTNGHILMFFYRVDGAVNPIQTSLCMKKSTDEGLTYGATTVIYTGSSASPRSEFIFKQNDDSYGLAWNVWVGGPGPTDYDYSSAVAHQNGLYFRSTDEGETWSAPATITAGNNAVFENMITQKRNAPNGTVGRLYMWYRSRGGFLGYAYSDDNGTTWSAGGPSTLVCSNDNVTVGFIKDSKTLFAMIIKQPPATNRKGGEIWVSYNDGLDWTFKFEINQMPLTSSYTSMPLNFFYYGGIYYINYYEGNSANTIWDMYQWAVPESALIGIDENPLKRTNGSVAQNVGGHWVTGGGGLLIDDIMLGNTAQRDPNTVLQITSLTAGYRPNVEIYDNKASNTGGKVSFYKLRSGSSPNTNDDIGSVTWQNQAQIRGVFNSDSLVNLNFETDQTGGGMVTVGKMLATGQFMIGNTNSFNPVFSYGAAQFGHTGNNSVVCILNTENNTNYSMLALGKDRGAHPTLGLTQGDYVGVVDFGFGTFGIGCQIVGVANGDANAGSRASDLEVWTTNSSAVNAKRWRFTGNGDFLQMSAHAVKGIVIPDGQGSPHYWRLKIVAGAVTADDLGTTAPT